MLTDSFGRVHDYLRISLTDKCNLRCSYCKPVDLPKGHFAGAPKMTADEIEQIASIFIKEGVRKIRLTGGEPLLRRDAAEIIQRLSSYPVQLTITTNGVFVDDFIDTFKKAGIKSVNVSLDSLRLGRYFSITKRDEFQRVFSNIHLLLKNDFHVKVNVVVMKGFNDDEILDFVEWTKDFPVHVRFIEFMPFPGNKWDAEKVFTYQQMLDVIASKYKYIQLLNEKNDTAKKYFVPKHAGSFAVISTMTQPFCNGCNRMRLTTDGKMRNCLFAKTETDLLTPLRGGRDILPLVRECLLGKHYMLGGNKDKHWASKETASDRRSMLGIGG